MAVPEPDPAAAILIVQAQRVPHSDHRHKAGDDVGNGRSALTD
jgi:hypothetical protein